MEGESPRTKGFDLGVKEFVGGTYGTLATQLREIETGSFHKKPENFPIPLSCELILLYWHFVAAPKRIERQSLPTTFMPLFSDLSLKMAKRTTF